MIADLLCLQGLFLLLQSYHYLRSKIITLLQTKGNQRMRSQEFVAITMLTSFIYGWLCICHLMVLLLALVASGVQIDAVRPGKLLHSNIRLKNDDLSRNQRLTGKVGVSSTKIRNILRVID